MTGFFQQMGQALGLGNTTIGQSTEQNVEPERNSQQPVQTQQQQNQQTTAQEKSDLDSWLEVLQTAGKETPSPTPSVNLDPTKLAEFASKQDFTVGISPELMQKALAGDPQAFQQVLSQANQNAFKVALSTSSGLTNETLDKRLEHERAQIRKEFMTHAATSSIDLDAHPVVKQQVIGIAKTLAEKFPHATPKQIQDQAMHLFKEQATSMFKALGMEVVDPKNPQSGSNVQQQQKASDVDWDAWFNKDDL